MVDAGGRVSFSTFKMKRSPRGCNRDLEATVMDYLKSIMITFNRFLYILSERRCTLLIPAPAIEQSTSHRFKIVSGINSSVTPRGGNRKKRGVTRIHVLSIKLEIPEFRLPNPRARIISIIRPIRAVDGETVTAFDKNVKYRRAN